jgi:hypothetical protein
MLLKRKAKIFAKERGRGKIQAVVNIFSPQQRNIWREIDTRFS